MPNRNEWAPVLPLIPGGLLGHLLQDLQFAWRSFGRTRGAVLVAVLTLAIGIGANAAIFSVIHDVLLDPLPYAHADRLVLLWRQNVAIGGGVQMSPSRTDAERWQTAPSLEGMTRFGAQSFTLTGGAEPEQVVARTIEPAIFDFLGVRPALGRPFTADEARSAAAARVVLLDDGFWRRRFGADPSIVGRTITLSDQPYAVIGVMPPHFRLPLGKGELWMPFVPPAPGSRAGTSATVLARLKPGASAEAAEADLTARMGANDIKGVPGQWRAHVMRPGELA